MVWLATWPLEGYETWELGNSLDFSFLFFSGDWNESVVLAVLFLLLLASLLSRACAFVYGFSVDSGCALVKEKVRASWGDCCVCVASNVTYKRPRVVECRLCSVQLSLVPDWCFPCIASAFLFSRLGVMAFERWYINQFPFYGYQGSLRSRRDGFLNKVQMMSCFR